MRGATDQKCPCHRSERGVPSSENRGGRHLNEGRRLSEWGGCTIEARDSTSRPDGGEGPKMRDPPIGMPSATDRHEGRTRSEPGVQPSGVGGATSRKWPCHRPEIPPPLFEAPQVKGEKRLDSASC